MADVFSKKKRSEIMSRIKGENTKLETVFLKRLSASFYGKGIRYRKHYRKLKGRPDIVFVSRKVAVFLDGEFWHGRNFRKLAPRLPKAYWLGKIQDNVNRDRRTNASLRRDGWTVLRFWETDVNKHPEKVISVISEALRGADGKTEKRGSGNRRVLSSCGRPRVRLPLRKPGVAGKNKGQSSN